MNKYMDKYDCELLYWNRRLKDDKGFNNLHYRGLMLAMANESNDTFLKGKIVADFGCGPCGSLVWADVASLRIGIDVLADRYADSFTRYVLSHGMIYLKSTEKTIPLPSNFVDVMFTLNAMDHVDNFSNMCHEIIRVLKPEGYFIGSFNIGCRSTATEPQTLSEDIIQKYLLQQLTLKSYKIAERGSAENVYAPILESKISRLTDGERVLWIIGTKK